MRLFQLTIPVVALAMSAAVLGDEPATHERPIDLTRRSLLERKAVVVPANVEIKPHVASSMGVRPSFDDMAALVVGSPVALPVEGGVDVHGIVERIERRGEDDYSIAGDLDDGGEFLLVRYGDALAGTIGALSRNARYDLRYVADGDHLVQKLDSSAIQPCGGACKAGAGNEPQREDIEGDAQRLLHQILEQAGIAEANGPEGACADDLGDILDVMIPYTANARTAAGGTSAIIAQCYLAVDTINEAFVNSLIDSRARLIWYGEVVYEEAGVSLQDALDDLTWVGGGLDDVRTTREAIGADLVGMLSENLSGGGGIGWCTINSAYGYHITEWYNITAYTFAHEVGHNLNCDHDPDNDDPDACGASWARGHRWGPTGDEWRSVLAYSPGLRVPWYSDAQITHMGYATGVVGSAENADAIRSNVDNVAAYRASRFDYWVDFDWPFGGSGTWGNPFNNLPDAIAQVIDTTGLSLPELPTLHIKPSTTSETIVITKPMRLSACNGSVVIGLQ